MNLCSRAKQISITVAFGIASVTSAFSQEIVKIGYSGPLSGGAALYGKNVLDGMQMAANEVNSAGFEVAGKKYKLEIVALDDKYNPSETAINAQRMVQEYKTPVILVAHSGGTYALQTTNEQQKYIVVAYTSLPQITERGNKMTLRIPPDFTAYVQPFVKYAMTRYGKNLAISAADHDYARTWIAAFKPAWLAAGGKIVSDNPMSYVKATDFYSGVSRVLATKPDVMFIGGPSEPTALVVKQARELGFKGGFVMLDQARFDEMAKVLGGYSMMEGAIGTLPFAQVPAPAAQAFTKRFYNAYPGSIPTWETSLNYTAVQLIVASMKMAGTVTDATAIRAQLDKAARQLPSSINPVEVSGVDDKGASTLGMYIGAIEGGKPVSKSAQDIK
ncbi:ABC transporter substrate-binding protein [Variovorax sp. 770b2]|uniref:ABC transporter substrate-binding protein n=1 Tax=Variovorax sp. 770b2 TaxID=1566271 RepID=UPI0008E58CCD|nr:ABC transporter substrate-binding protein [Variovorax sp. 770b2]SFQ05371.1 branched-chain amino acid transport system substrate-binding protein [Variovorax sp. 770b2]